MAICTFFSNPNPTIKPGLPTKGKKVNFVLQIAYLLTLFLFRCFVFHSAGMALVTSLVTSSVHPSQGNLPIPDILIRPLYYHRVSYNLFN